MFDNIFAAIEKWMRELLSGMVESNLSTMFTAVNQQTSEIAAQVGQTPQGWNSSIFSMIRNISDSVVIPIAGIIITLILCYELISMLTERNNLHDVDTWMFFKYFVKMWIAVYLVSHTFDIAMAVFDIGQSVVNSSSGIIRGNTAIDISSLSMQAAMATMAIGELVTLALETLVVSWCLKILSVVITVIMYGRMIEIYLYTSLAPIPFATMSNREWGHVGTNYFRGLFALAFQAFLIKRALTTTSTAIFVPFTTQELFMEGDSLYYGLNAVSNNMIMADRKQLKNPNGLILGTPGSGKSFSAKREITNVFFTTTDDIIVADPEGEYYPLVEALGGQVIHISSTSKDYINPMDINLNYADDDNPLGMKSDFILSLCELIMGARDGMEPEEKSVIDRCLPLVYQKYLNDPKPENMPTLGDLYDCLREQKERQAQRIATALEIYVNGSLRVFNHQTNVELDNRIICFDIKELGKQLKKLGMLIVQDQVWNRVTVNRNSKKNTRYYIDEFHLLLKEEQTAAYSVEIWKRFRKWGGVPTGITQNIKDLLASREIENIFENSDFIYMLNQASGDRQILAKQLNISPFQLSYVTNSNEGEGLLFYGNTIIPFKDKFDTSLKLYSLMTTKPNEMGKYKEKKEA